MPREMGVPDSGMTYLPAYPMTAGEPGSAVAVMQPIAFASCFGWLHRPASLVMLNTGVVLCTGLGRDASTAYRSLRILAGRLAAAGYPTLRFDYPGTGDSCDPDASPSWAMWQHSVHAAADWLRATTDVQRVVLIGLRAGGTLATLAAAERTDVVSLVLLEPVLRGKSYVSQMMVQARLQPEETAAPGQGIALDGLSLSETTLAQMAAVDLRTVALPDACAVGVFSRGSSAVLSACLQRWNSAGRQVLVGGFGGLEALLRPTHLVDEPSPDFTPVTSWLRSVTEARHLRRSVPLNPTSTELFPLGCREVPIRFGAGEHLFGIVCQPDLESIPGLAVLIGNTGGDPHHGFARFSVEFARRLAAAGIASLRLDFAGLGDSTDLVRGDEAPSHVFGIDRTPDFRAAIEVMADMGYRRFAMNGLCSGAYHAFCSGVADPRIEALLLINLPWFSLQFEKAGPDSFAKRSMDQLLSRRTHTLLLFAAGDSGIKALERHFGPGGVQLAASGVATVSILDGIDHNLTGPVMRARMAALMIDFLRSLPGPDADPALPRSCQPTFEGELKE